MNMSSLRLAQRQDGIGKWTALVFFSIFGAALYAAYHILPFYYAFYEMQNQMDSVIRVAGTETDKEIRKRLVYHIEKLDLPVDPDEDLKIERDNGTMRIYMSWDDVFSIEFRGEEKVLRVFHFDAYAEGAYELPHHLKPQR